MAVDHLPATDPWRRIIEGPNFMAFPAKDLSDPSATFHDAYVIKLDESIEEGGWVPHKEVDAFIRAQVIRLSAILTSDQEGDLITLGETSEETLSKNAEEVTHWAVRTLKQHGPWAQMTDRDAANFYFQLLDRIKARCGLRSTDPALATADKKVLGPGVEIVLDHASAQAVEHPQAQALAATYTALLVGTPWGKSPFRERLVEIAAD